MIVFNGIEIKEVSLVPDPDGDSLLVVRVPDIRQPAVNDQVIIDDDTYFIVGVYAKDGDWYLTISDEKKI